MFTLCIKKSGTWVYFSCCFTEENQASWSPSCPILLPSWSKAVKLLSIRAGQSPLLYLSCQWAPDKDHQGHTHSWTSWMYSLLLCGRTHHGKLLYVISKWVLKIILQDLGFGCVIWWGLTKWRFTLYYRKKFGRGNFIISSSINLYREERLEQE